MNPLALVATMQRRCKEAGYFFDGADPRRNPPQPGDIIFLRHRGASDAGPGHHVGIVERLVDVYVESIEGNWGDVVARVRRHRGSPSIWGYARVS